MATINDVLNWYDRDLARFAPKKTCIEIIEHSGSSEGKAGTVLGTLKFRIYTDNNVYKITAEEKERDYLGCIASCRKQRAGEDWTRGRDMANGPLSEETWRQILADIVSFELVKVHKAPSESMSDLVGIGSVSLE